MVGFPFVVLTSRHIYPKEDALRARLLGALGNVSLMERPLSSVSLISAVKSGLRARQRQLETQSMLEHLRASEERLRLFIEHAPAALVMLDREMRYLAVSRRWMKDFGLSVSIVGRNHYDVFPEIPAEWREGHQRCLRGETEVSTNNHLQLADGRSFRLKRDVRPWRDNQGTIGGLIVSWEDITARKQAEEQQQMLMREVMHRTEESDRRHSVDRFGDVSKSRRPVPSSLYVPPACVGRRPWVTAWRRRGRRVAE